MSRITLLAYGTRGDVQPFCGIGLALKARGHQVRVASPTNHVKFVERCGLESAPIHGDSEELLSSPEGQKWMASGNIMLLMKRLGEAMAEMAPKVERDIEAAIEGAECTVAGVFTYNAARTFAMARRTRAIPFHTYPGMPSRHIPHGLVTTRWLPEIFNPLTAELTVKLGWWANRGILDGHRARLGLPPTREEGARLAFREKRTSIHAWSPALQPRPPDWGENDVVTGFCSLPPTSREKLGESDEIRRLTPFIEAGPAPFYLGLGSMPVLDPDRFLSRIVTVTKALGIRALVGGSESLWQSQVTKAGLPDNVMLCRPVDHDTLFPRCAGVMHHGGAGSTATGLRAGLPTFICSVFGDQNFWGHLVEKRGLGAWSQFRALDERSLREGLQALMNPEVKARAAAVGALMREERGSETAALAIEKAIREESPPDC